MRRTEFSRILASVLALLLAGCAHNHAANRADVSGARPSEAHYAHLFGQRYRTKVDLYLFTFTDPDYKYLGRNGGDIRLGPKELPPAVSRENIGRVYKRWTEDGTGDLKILDLVPAGSELTIAAETHEVTPLSGVRESGGYPMGFICTLNYDGKQAEGVLAEFIQSHKKVSGKIPNQEINETVATRIAR